MVHKLDKDSERDQGNGGSGTRVLMSRISACSGVVKRSRFSRGGVTD